MAKQALVTTPDNHTISKIFFICGKNGLFDSDLTELYDAETKLFDRVVETFDQEGGYGVSLSLDNPSPPC